MNFALLYPQPFDFDMNARKVKFFLGDRWIAVGDIQIAQQKSACMDITMPDIEGFLHSREFLDDGTFDWLEWGPRVN